MRASHPDKVICHTHRIAPDRPLCLPNGVLQHSNQTLVMIKFRHACFTSDVTHTVRRCVLGGSSAKLKSHLPRAFTSTSSADKSCLMSSRRSVGSNASTLAATTCSARCTSRNEELLVLCSMISSVGLAQDLQIRARTLPTYHMGSPGRDRSDKQHYRILIGLCSQQVSWAYSPAHHASQQRKQLRLKVTQQGACVVHSGAKRGSIGCPAERGSEQLRRKLRDGNK